jgi:chloramphenicol-sensitive protein RarD
MPSATTATSYSGLACATAAFLIWGLSPIYFKLVAHVPPFEILLHRMVWSFLFLLPLLLLLGRWNIFINVLKSKRTLGLLMATTILAGSNWFIFIWAITNNHILQASLGYYINPLVNVLLAMVFLGERLRRLQAISVIIALAGVIYITVNIGRFPWVSLALALTFALYGLIRKVSSAPALEGLTIETLLLFAPAAGYLFYLNHQGLGAIFNINCRTDLLLATSALVTAVPLLLFTIGARRLTFITIGFLQYIAPSSTFLLAVFAYHEPFSTAQAITFAMIWSALALFSVDAVNTYKKAHT